MITMKTSLATFVLTTLFVLSLATTASAANLRTVALTGSQAPDTPSGANFDILPYRPVLNSAGRTAFRGFLQTGAGGVTLSNYDGLWSEGSGSLALVARVGSQAPGAPSGANFNGFGDTPVLNNAGQTALLGGLQTGAGGVTSINDIGIWSEGSGSLALVARSGSQAPGTPSGANFSAFGVPALNNAGQTAFRGFLQTGAGGVTSSNDRGIWSEGSGSLALVARSGSQAPGTPSGANFDWLMFPVLNSAGQTAFEGILRIGAGGVTSSNRRGIWSEGSGSLALVAREGSQAPGTPSGANFGQLYDLEQFLFIHSR